MEDSRQRKIRVLMLPWLAYGHISPFLELAKRLSNRNFHIYFCSTLVNLTSIKLEISEKYYHSIQLVELHLSSLPELPPNYQTTKGLPPHLMLALKKAFDMASPDFSNILKTLNPDLLIYDFLQPWVPALALSQKIPSINFMTMGATMISFLLHIMKNPDDEFPFQELHLQDYRKLKLTQLDKSYSSQVLLWLKQPFDSVLIKTFPELEGKRVDYLSALMGKKVVPVGPLVQEAVHEDNEKTNTIEWLDEKEPSSSVFVSFGSEYFLSKEDLEEIAYGLEFSKVNFIWVIRFPLTERIKFEEALPRGFLGRVGSRGKIVENWAPQAKILAHSSIGGFLSHCGWSSVMESMKFGVPIIAMPMHIDQPINARLVEEVGVGTEVKRNKDGKFAREEVAKVIKEVMLENKGNDIRRKSGEMGENIRIRGEKDIEGVVDELTKLCVTGI
ncbi:Glycosyltransferase [Quillaja saponaria]|uniref:Glycosyltransferase n=1 Tax=Quillaja saponaria TaxID=32244 RepID=A0AAD7P5F7_QUISA|nr:Glycosyltransferase [Quillaja saponaria]